MSKQQPIKIDNASHVHYHNAPPSTIASFLLWFARAALLLLSATALRTVLAGEWQRLVAWEWGVVTSALLGGEWVARKWGK